MNNNIFYKMSTTGTDERPCRGVKIRRWQGIINGRRIYGGRDTAGGFQAGCKSICMFVKKRLLTALTMCRS